MCKDCLTLIPQCDGTGLAGVAAQVAAAAERA
jgi:hypothetical protein